MVKKQKIQEDRRWPPFGFSILVILLNINEILLETARKHHFICQNYDISRNI